MLVRFKLVLVLILLLISGIAAANEKPIPENQWNKNVKVWAARACIGEAGFAEYEECAQMLWVFAKKAKQQKVPFIVMVKEYSSPVKQRDDHPRPWLFNLHIGMRSAPKHWPSLKWTKHKTLWENTLALVQAWADGLIPDKFPLANEFGGPMDTPRARRMKMKRIGRLRPNGNIFWRSKGAI